MSARDVAVPGKGRRQLLLLIALFLLPPIAAWIAWHYLGESGVAATTNAGVLISPARPLEVTGLRADDGTPVDGDLLRGRWTYVLFDDGRCASDLCAQQLFLTRQTRIAMNKDMRRVQRVMILANEPDPVLAETLATEHADLRWVVRDAGADNLLEAFHGAAYDASGTHFFLVDPLGNLMMVYDRQTAPKGLMKDLQKLLKVSQIG
jgi:cytochrome oxidase Cu insertion factor (SCO1/SenC/PrrC family)